GLNSQHCGEWHVNELEVARFELAFYTNAGIVLFDLHDDGGMRPAQQFRENDTGLGVAVIIRLKPGENQIELLILDCRAESTSSVVGIEADKSIVLKMDGPVRTLGQSFPQNLLRPRGAGRDNDHFTAVLLFLAQSFF